MSDHECDCMLAEMKDVPVIAYEDTRDFYCRLSNLLVARHERKGICSVWVCVEADTLINDKEKFSKLVLEEMVDILKIFGIYATITIENEDRQDFVILNVSTGK